MNLKSYSLIFCFFWLSLSSHSQESWSLERCISYAFEHSLTIRQSRLDAKQSSINQIAAKQLRAPNLNGSSNYNISYGRQIDPTTNDFINQRFNSQNLSVNGGITLFAGGRINSQIRQSNLAVDAADLDIEQLENDLALNIAQTYLQILFAEENLANAKKSLELIQAQLDQMEKMIRAGSRPRNAGLDLVAQVAQSEQMVINSENEITIGYLNLRQLLQMEDTLIRIEIPEISLPSEYDIAALNTKKVYESALSWQPNIRSGLLRRKQAELGVLLSKTDMMPSLSLGFSVGSRFSSFTRRQGPQIDTETTSQDIFLNGEMLVLSFDQPIFDFQKVSYLDQINENLAYGLGLNLAVPIYNQGRSKANLQLAQLDVVRTEISNQQLKNDLRANVERAITDVKAGKKQYEAAVSTVEATRAAYQDTEKRFGLGVANSLEFVTAQNNRDQAETNLLIAKYDYLFRLKVLDFYQGKKLTLN
ncbi:MAG: TolC family protein [Saprospiraceae bacterium]|nr:TolC family protein [Saprospiraceae bacterium]